MSCPCTTPANCDFPACPTYTKGMQCHRCTSDASCDFPDCMVTGEFAYKRPTVGMEDPAPDVPPAKDWVLAALILTTAVVAVCLYGQVLDTLIHQLVP